MNICSFKETKIGKYISTFLDNGLLGLTQGDIYLNPKSQKVRPYIPRKKGGKWKHLPISISGLLFSPYKVEDKWVSHMSPVLQSGVVLEGSELLNA